jgi:hypothetical protein
VLKDFLYIGAGFDHHQRMLPTLPLHDLAPDAFALLQQERAAWFRKHKIASVLNMAGSAK